MRTPARRRPPGRGGTDRERRGGKEAHQNTHFPRRFGIRPDVCDRRVDAPLSIRAGCAAQSDLCDEVGFVFARGRAGHGRFAKNGRDFAVKPFVIGRLSPLRAQQLIGDIANMIANARSTVVERALAAENDEGRQNRDNKGRNGPGDEAVGAVAKFGFVDADVDALMAHSASNVTGRDIARYHYP
jgi:hypothetical protein